MILRGAQVAHLQFRGATTLKPIRQYFSIQRPNLTPGFLPRPGAWLGVSEVGHDEVEMVGVLPTLLPKCRNAEPVKNPKVAIYREEDDGPSGTRTQDLGIKRLLTGVSDCGVSCRCVRPERHPGRSAWVYMMFCDVASGCVRLHGVCNPSIRRRRRSGGSFRRWLSSSGSGEPVSRIGAGADSRPPGAASVVPHTRGSWPTVVQWCGRTFRRRRVRLARGYGRRR